MTSRTAHRAGLAAAIALHALLLLLVAAALRPPLRAKDDRPTLQVWLPPLRATPAPSPRAAAPRREPARPPPTPVPAITAPANTEPTTSTRPEMAASQPSLLETDATRRAIADAARKPAHAASSAQERLGRDIARAAHGDCLKGEFAGAGMGLLSLPFWLAAELRDKCRR